MKQSRLLVAAIGSVAISAFAIATLARMPHSEDQPKKPKDKIAAALDSLEQQLQRRFHDRQNIQFGYSRVVRPNARMHGEVVSNIGLVSMLREDGKPVNSRKVGNTWEYELEEGLWVKQGDVKQRMHPENDAERKLREDLKNIDVAIYTAGAFNSTSGEPMRLKGPAYLRQSSATAPVASSIAKAVARAWKTTSDADEMRLSGWLYRVVKVRADDESCLKCHNAMPYYGEGSDTPSMTTPVQLNEPLGTFVIATKIK